MITVDEFSETMNWDLLPLRDNGEQTFSSDDMIDAYLKGKKDLVTQNQQTLLDKLESNLKLAKDYSENIYNSINSQGFNCELLRLNIQDIYNFKTIFLINEDDFCNDKFLTIYEESIEIKKELIKNPTFEFTTVFTPNSEDIDVKSMLADGYNLSYGIH
tara:strand:- start:67037 stop:67513 length:477 start_codon:yes stop_codon:yes gene_type:complete